MVTSSKDLPNNIKASLVGFILQWRWHAQHNLGMRHTKKIRTVVAEKFRQSIQFANKEWMIDEFCQAYDFLTKEDMIRL